MEANHFDGWTRLLTTSLRPRRFVLGALTGAGLRGLIGVAPDGNDATARRKKRKKRCKGGTRRCGKTCVDGVCCPGQACGEDCICERGVNGTIVCTGTRGIVACSQCASDDDCVGNGQDTVCCGSACRRPCPMGTVMGKGCECQVTGAANRDGVVVVDDASG